MLRLRGHYRGGAYELAIERRSSPGGAVYLCRLTGPDGAVRNFQARVLSRTGARWTLDVDGAIQDLVVSRYGGRILVDWDNRNYQLSLFDPREHAFQTAHSMDQESRSVIAPMAGRVVSVAHGPGDSVAAGESLATLEAMKMLNQIKAPQDAVVRRCAIEPGQSVKAGEVLFELE